MAKILVVDDRPDNLKLLCYALQDLGYEVIAAAGGVEALERTANEHPDVILLDVRMPDLDGVEVCRRIKFDAALAPIPIIMLSALYEEEDVIRGLSAGAQDYVTEPYNSKILAARVQTAVRTKAAHDRHQTLIQELEALNAQLQEASQDLEAFSRAASHDLKSPLHRMATLCHLLQQDEGERLSTEGQEQLSTLAHLITQQMAQLIEDVLAHARTSHARIDRAHPANRSFTPSRH